MEEEVRRKIEELLTGMHCPKNFRCAENDFEALCKAKDIGLESYLLCLEDKPFTCPFSQLFGDKYFCQCHLRVFLSKELKK
jgi:hypothetical protein